MMYHLLTLLILAVCRTYITYLLARTNVNVFPFPSNELRTWTKLPSQMAPANKFDFPIIKYLERQLSKNPKKLVNRRNTG